jgi:4-amino-4-deoxy-L-arabinose transferase-like glycosyltransferase
MQPARHAVSPPILPFRPAAPSVIVAPFPGSAASPHRLAAWPYAALVLALIFAGLIGHDPWKADEAYVFGLVQHMLATGDWVVPTLAGDPFMEKPPLFYWVAAACAWLFSGWLPLHDGARLASALFMLLACWATAATARLWWGAGMGRYAVLVLVGCLGTLVQSHMLMPDIALLAGFALSAFGFSRIAGRAVAGGLALGLGAGIAFMAKGLLGPAVMGITAVLLPLLFSSWRTAAYGRGLAIAAAVAAPWCLIWPVALYVRSPALFMDWFWINNIGRFVGFSVPQLGTEHLPWFWSKTLPWFTFPGLPIALWMVWKKRATLLTEAPLQYALVAFGVLMAVLAVSSSGRCIYAWPLMVPVAILAAPAARQLPRSVDGLWAVASLLLFGLFSLLVWSGWTVMMINGAPPAWGPLARWLPAGFVPRFDAGAVAVALLAGVAAVCAVRLLWSRPGRGLRMWVIGLTTAWTLLTTLWMPWLDYAKSYRSVFAAMPLPAPGDCIASINLGEGERAMLRYVTGYNPLRREVHPVAACNTLLVQREVAYGEPDVDRAVWQEAWRGARPGVTNERFWLFRRAP